jgi:putative CocE/NonD family hydrolase
MSGTLAYPALLLSQLIILALFGTTAMELSIGKGLLARPRRTLGGWLLVAGALYFGVMVVRYVIRMGLYPEERWTGGSIPIFFHLVLASFILIVAGYHRFQPIHGSDVAVRRSRSAQWIGRLGRGALGLFVLIGLALWITWQLAPTLLAHNLGARPAEYAVAIDRNVGLITTDGTRLKADVYHPRGAGTKTPTILVRLPGNKTFENGLKTDVVGRMWAERGYTFVVQGVRGRFGSSGEHYPFRDERKDGKETLSWLSKQPWWDGRLGMLGGSYFAYTQWVLADQKDPGPSAFLMQIASSDNHAMFYPGGAFSLESALYWASLSHGDRDVKPSTSALEKGFTGFPLREADDRAGHDVDFFNDWVDHPDKDAYWSAADGENRPAQLQSPVLLMGGWYDPYLPSLLQDFAVIREQARSDVADATRLIVGPWTHARTVVFPDGATPSGYRLESIRPAIAWFDQHLRGTDEPRMAPVRIYVMGEHRWRNEEEWPLARTRYTPYYLHGAGDANTLHGDGELRVVPSTEASSDSYVYDPLDPVPSAGGAMLGPRSGIALQNEVEQRTDVLVYTSPILEEAIEVTGPVELVLYVSTTAPRTDFTAKLVDVYPGGAAYNVSEGVLRRSYEEADTRVKIRVELWPTSILFRSGHRIRLEISSSSNPRFDRNPNTAQTISTAVSTIPARQTIYHGPALTSHLVLPIIPR